MNMTNSVKYRVGQLLWILGIPMRLFGAVIEWVFSALEEYELGRYKDKEVEKEMKRIKNSCKGCDKCSRYKE
jgi:hypothetical protein